MYTHSPRVHAFTEDERLGAEEYAAANCETIVSLPLAPPPGYRDWPTPTHDTLAIIATDTCIRGVFRRDTGMHARHR